MGADAVETAWLTACWRAAENWLLPVKIALLVVPIGMLQEKPGQAG
jgi:hypothetical protein